MDARDFRGIGRPAQEELRRRALWLIEQQGLSQAEAAQVVGLTDLAVNGSYQTSKLLTRL